MPQRSQELDLRQALLHLLRPTQHLEVLHRHHRAVRLIQALVDAAARADANELALLPLHLPRAADATLRLECSAVPAHYLCVPPLEPRRRLGGCAVAAAAAALGARLGAPAALAIARRGRRHPRRVVEVLDRGVKLGDMNLLHSQHHARLRLRQAKQRLAVHILQH